MIKIKSEITKKEINAVEATLKFEFGNHTVTHDVYWGSTGEIFPKQRGLSFDTLMGELYDLPTSVWDSKLLSDKIAINEAPQYNSNIYGNSKNGIYTNKDIVAHYIKQKLAPVQTKKMKP